MLGVCFLPPPVDSVDLELLNLADGLLEQKDEFGYLEMKPLRPGPYSANSGRTWKRLAGFQRVW